MNIKWQRNGGVKVNRFIQGDNFDKQGGKAEEIVWKTVKSAFSNREVIGYSKYPFFRKQGGKRREPDILLLDKEEGLVIYEVKGYFIEEIEQVEPNLWHMKAGYEQTSNPIDQVEDYVFNLKNKLESERMLRNKVRARGIVVLPYIMKEEWISRGFDVVTENFPILFKEDLRKDKLLAQSFSFEPLQYGTPFNDEAYALALAILGYEDMYVDNASTKHKFPEGSKGKIIADLKNMVYRLDEQQETIGKTIPPGPQRIRGIAGSGKTLLLCQKAAYMHLKYPEWKIAFVFATQSLYDMVITLLDRYLKAFSGGEVGYQEGGNLQVLHAWGRANKPGFYREVASRHGIRPLNVKDVKQGLNSKYSTQSESVNYICKRLLEDCKESIEQIYDVILIDEGQDLISTPSLLYKSYHPFYYLAYLTLKSNEVEDKKVKRLIWAYDELQSLDTSLIPSWKAIIGDDASMGSGPIYKGGMKKSEIMKTCYRVPNEILSIAHGLGMGWFREAGMLTGYTQKQHWEDIGYEVISGDFRKLNSEIILKRNEKYSLNPIKSIYKGSLIEFNCYQSQYDMANALAQKISNDITYQGLNPSRDILIINLNDRDTANTVRERLNHYGVSYYIPSMVALNEWETEQKKPEIFWMDGGVTISKVMRAKGNEAPMVYVIGLEEVAKHEDRIEYRNKLFVALTRTKCFVTLMGVGRYTLYDEIDIALSSKGTFKMKYKKPSRIVDDVDL